jgi:hypothetical protein
MIYEFIVYPHEVCYRPLETIGHCYQVSDFVESYTDSFSFQSEFSGEPQKVTRDKFDEMCSDNDRAISFCYLELKNICEMIVDSVGKGSFAFNLHNKDTYPSGELKKPHFHVLFLLPDSYNFSVFEFYDKLGMFTYVSDDFEKRGKKYTRWVRRYPTQPFARYFVYKDFMRSSRLRYLCHLDNPEKFQYSLSLVVADFDYLNDKDVLVKAFLNPWALFISIKEANHLNDEVDYFNWLACSNPPDDVLKQLKSIKTDIHRYYVAVYYKVSKKPFSYS